MEPDIPSGRAAREAWRALSPQARHAALAAADRGAPVTDTALAWAAAGYGRMMARQLRLLTALIPFGTILLVFAVTMVGVTLHSVAPTLAVLFVVLIGYLVAMFAMRTWVRKYRRVYDSGLLGMEATRLGAPMPAPDPSVWQPTPYESGFTVPYGATVTQPGPLPRPPVDPVAAGERTVPMRRRTLVFPIAFFGLLSTCFWGAGIAALHATPLAAVLPIALALFVTALFAFILFGTAPALRTGATARFTPSGWSLAGVGVSGPWTAVREIRVSPVRTRGGSGALAGYRVVALVTDHPEGYLSQFSPVRRVFVRRTMRKYGSPVVIVAAPRRTMPLVELVQLVQRYTDAPVTWG